MITLFTPFTPETMKTSVVAALGKRIIGQGKTVEEFEKRLSFLGTNVLTVNSGTSALEIAYDLLDLEPGDEVISSVFTFVGANIPLVRRGVKVVFADVGDNLLVDWHDVRSKITSRTRAVINTHLFGLYNKAPYLPVPVIGDACQYLGKTKGELMTAYSFQATKIITTVDGGALVCAKKKDYNRAKLLRWFGADRKKVFGDIKEAGYKYHMNDVTASMGIAALRHLIKLQTHRQKLIHIYKKVLGRTGGSPFLIYSSHRDKLQKLLLSHGFETGLVHKRNDLYSLFGGKRQDLPTMNGIESTYLFLPCHYGMTVQDVERICRLVKKYDYS